MEAKELRIGNLIFAFIFSQSGKHYYEFVVGALNVNSLSDKDQNSTQYNLIEGAPLTTQWFVKLGFINNSSENNGSEWIGGLREHGDFRIFLQDKKIVFIKYYPKNIEEDGYWLPTEIQHVHQLQNLYFALTGEELILKA